MFLAGHEELLDIETVSLQLSNSGLARDIQVDASTLQTLQQLSMWLATLTLHLLAAVPEYKSRRGPGFSLLQDKQSLLIIRELLVMIRLWNISNVSILSTEKEMDLIARVYSLVTRLSVKADDESLIDECLMLPHKVMIPPLDTVLSPKGVLGSLRNMSGSPLSFTLCVEPDLQSLSHTPFLEGLTYTEDPTADFYYDSVQKLYQTRKALLECGRRDGIRIVYVVDPGNCTKTFKSIICKANISDEFVAKRIKRISPKGILG